MQDKLRETFDMIRADEELLEKTKRFVAEKSSGSFPAGREKKRGVKRVMSIAACLALILLGLGGYGIYFTPVSAVSMDMDPSVEMEINRFGKVISIEGCDEEGKELARTADVKFMDYDEAVSFIIETEIIKECLARGEEMDITAVGEDGVACDRMTTRLKACTRGQENVYCHGTAMEKVRDAHKHGCSYGKYSAYLEMKKIDPDITVEDVKGMTTREIRQRCESHRNERHDEGKGNRGSGSGGGFRKRSR